MSIYKIVKIKLSSQSSNQTDPPQLKNRKNLKMSILDKAVEKIKKLPPYIRRKYASALNSSFTLESIPDYYERKKEYYITKYRLDDVGYDVRFKKQFLNEIGIGIGEFFPESNKYTLEVEEFDEYVLEQLYREFNEYVLEKFYDNQLKDYCQSNSCKILREDCYGEYRHDRRRICIEESRLYIRPISPNTIYERYDININDQLEFNIVIQKKNIEEFACSYGRKLKFSRDIKKKFSAEGYFNFFNEKISRANNKTRNSKMVYTYAEILVMLGLKVQIISDEVINLFRELNMCNTGNIYRSFD